ncbi:MAG: Phosphoglycerate kinase [Patescibacteria group bacterium]|nr:Phosphoglycerate kinase [Patescibacteria group bacterium]
MKTISQIKNMTGKRALVRVDYNIPLKGNKILDSRRIDASFDTIRALQKKGLQVTLLAHLGDGSASLKPIASYLSKHFKVKFITKSILENPSISETKDTIILFENIRKYEGEEKNDKAFAKTLSGLGDIFVNDAFSVSHRSHASVVGVAKFLPSYAGIQLEKEIKNLSKLLENKKHPFLFILGGAKFDTKIPLLKRFIDSADSVFVSGAIANSFFKVAGFEIGSSVAEDSNKAQIKKLLSSPKLLLPVDVVVLRGKKKITLTLTEILKGDVIVDIGLDTIRNVSEKIKKAKVIVWNGPTGWYEKGFSFGTTELAKAMKDSKGYILIGGGDTGAVVDKVVGEAKNIFISTGGGATLEYLAKGTLPGIKAL